MELKELEELEIKSPHNEKSQLKINEEKIQNANDYTDVQKFTTFSDPLPAAVEYSQQSFLPVTVMEHYKKFGLDEQTIKALFYVRPPTTSSDKPVIVSPSKTCGG